MAQFKIACPTLWTAKFISVGTEVLRPDSGDAPPSSLDLQPFLVGFEPIRSDLLESGLASCVPTRTVQYSSAA